MKNDKKMPLGQLALICAQPALEKALMTCEGIKRLSHNFWGYDFFKIFPVDSPVPIDPWKSKLTVSWWNQVVGRREEYPIYQLHSELLKNTENTLDEKQKQHRLLYKSGSSIFYIDPEKLSSDKLTEILKKYHFGDLKQNIAALLRDILGTDSKVVDDEFEEAIEDMLEENNKAARHKKLCTILFDQKEDEEEYSDQIAKIKMKISIYRKQQYPDDKESLLKLLGKEMEEQGIENGWTTQYVIDQIESPYAKLVWTCVLLFSDLTMYNTIDQIQISGFPQLLPFLHAGLSIAFTSYCFLNWYESHQLSQYKRYHTLDTCLKERDETVIIRLESHVLAIQAGVMSLCAYLLTTDDYSWQPPEADWKWGLISASVMGFVMVTATWAAHRYYATQHAFSWKQYLSLTALALGAGACFGMASTMTHLDLLDMSQRSADLLVLNSERTLLLLFGFGLYGISATASVAREKPNKYMPIK